MENENTNIHLSSECLTDFFDQNRFENDCSSQGLHLRSCHDCQKRLQEQKQILVFTDSSFQSHLLDEVSLKRVELSLTSRLQEQHSPRLLYRENIFLSFFNSHALVLAGFAVLLVFGFWGIRTWHKASFLSPSSLSAPSSFSATNNIVSKNLVVTQNEKLNFSLENGSHLRLEPYSQLSIVESALNSTVISLSKGKVEFEVPKLLPGQKFVVQTPKFQVQVIGTVFQVAWNEQSGSVNVTEGIVAVYANDGSSYSLKPGEQYVYHVEQKIMHQVIRSHSIYDNQPTLLPSSQPSQSVKLNRAQPSTHSVSKEKQSSTTSNSEKTSYSDDYQTIKDHATLGILSEQELSHWINSVENQSNDQFLPSLIELGKFLQEKYLKQLAIAVFEKAYSIQPTEEVLIELIRGSFTSQKYDVVLRYSMDFKKSYPLSSAVQEVGYTACQSAVLLQDFHKAISLCKEHVSQYPNGVTAKDTHYLLATIYREKFQDCVNAITEYTFSLVYTSLGSTRPEALYWRGMCYYEIDETDRALNDFHQLLQSYSDFPRIQEVTQMILDMNKSSSKNKTQKK